MCSIVTLEKGGMLIFVPDCYKNQKMCNKAVDNYPHELEYFPHCFKTQKMCNKAVDTYLSAMQFFPECCKTQKMCDKAVDTCPFMFDSVLD